MERLGRPHFASAVSSHPVSAHAVGEVVGEVLERLGTHPDLAVVLVTGGHAGALEDIGAAVRAILSPSVLLGAASGVVVGPGGDVEGGPGMALWCGLVGPVAPLLPGVPAGRPSFVPSVAVLLGDPTSPPESQWWATMSAATPAGPGGHPSVVGGRTTHPGLLVQDRIVTRTAVGALLGPSVRPTVVSSEGGRAIGRPMVVTRAERSVVYELDGRPALERLMELVTDGMPADDVRLVNAGLRIEVLEEAGGVRPGAGGRPGAETGAGPPALVVWGADRSNGALGLDAPVADGATIRFQVRDPRAASEAFARALVAADPSGPAGGLIFRSEQRGGRWFAPGPTDAALVGAALPAVALTGCSTTVQLDAPRPPAQPATERTTLLLLESVDGGHPGG